MKIIRKIEEMQTLSLLSRRQGLKIGLVPTMGALHEGHLSLIKAARRENDLVVVSIFVNPVQFGPNEDFKKYPRNFRRDASLCKGEGVDILFYPSAVTMYPPGFKTYVEVKDLSKVLCGISRPGHFCGVATVVAKLFNIVQPDRAYFGQKDAQQVTVIRRMVRDLNILVTVRVMPTIREKGGLALSSRNDYLNPIERKDALVLSAGLKTAAHMFKAGERNAKKLIRSIRSVILKKKSAKIDYIAIVDPQTLKLVSKINRKTLIALAVRIGRVRLIDNIIING